MADDDVGQFFIDGSGSARYEPYLHRLPSSGHHRTSIKKWYSSAQTPAETDIYFEDLIWDDGKDRAENDISYRWHKVNLAAAAQVYRLHVDDIPLIPHGQTFAVTAVGEGDIIADPRVPVHTTDITVNTESGGGGTDLLASIITNSGTVAASGSTAFNLEDSTVGHFTGTVRNGKHQVRITDASGTTALGFIGTADTDGDGTKVILFTDKDLGTPGYVDTDTGWDETDTPLTYAVYNVTLELITGFEGNTRQIRVINSSASDGFITFLQLYAKKGTKVNESIARAENAESQSFIGRRRIEHTSLHLDKFVSCQRRARARLGERSVPRERVVLTMHNATQANLMQMIHRQMSDQVDIAYSDMGIDAHYWVEKKTLELTEGNTKVECDWELTSVDTWLAGSATNGARCGLARCR